MQNEQNRWAERDWRYARVRAAMAGAGLDGVLAFAPGWRRESVRYLALAAPRGSFAFVYLPAVGNPTACAPLADDCAALAAAGWIGDVRPLTVPDAGELAARLREGGAPGRLGVAHLELLPHALAQALQDQLPHTQIVSATRLMDQVRLVKSDWELAQIRTAGAVCDAGWRAFLATLSPGVVEYEVVAAVEYTLKSLGAEDNFMLIASGRDEVMGMTPPGRRRLQPGDLVRTELTPQVGGYYAQICRTAVVGPPDDGQRRSHELFAEALAAGLSVTRAGVTAHDIARAENDVFRKYGYGEYCTSQYTRVRGHGLGLHPDEAPSLLEGVETVLEENAVIIVHPNTFTPLAGYHVFGDPVVVTRDGYDLLLQTERELFTA